MPDGQQLADYLRIAQITSLNEEDQSGPDEANGDVNLSEGQALRLEGPPKFRSAKQSLRSLSRRAETFQIKSASYGSPRLTKYNWLLADFLSSVLPATGQ